VKEIFAARAGGAQRGKLKFKEVKLKIETWILGGSLRGAFNLPKETVREPADKRAGTTFLKGFWIPPELLGMGMIIFLISVSFGQFSSSTFGSMNARHLGPAVMSGRITAIDAVNDDSRIVYVGTAGGGLWKSVTGGTLFKPVFDKYCQSIGAVTIDQKNPDIVWVGTGESNMRNSVGIGKGLYKSEDGGETWELMGLENTQHIAKIILDPNNSNRVYVAVPGPLFNDSEERGLFKSEDGGRRWEKILYVNERTGCADIVLDPKNPKIIYASMWEFRRQPWAFASGGVGSGLYKSYNGGETWERIDKDFTEPGSALGRICLAISPSDPNIVYAIAESQKTGLFISRDGGKTWRRTNSVGNVVSRPFYFSVLMVDPSDPMRVYRPAFSLSISDDGGESFRDASTEGGWIHSDHHALWIDVKNPNHLYLGTDGGVYVSFDRGNNWMFLNNLPVSQFYHVSYDLEKPYNVYGGLQDNGTWMGPSSAPGGVRGQYWRTVSGGDGFWVFPDLKDKEYVYAESQGGEIIRFNKLTNERKSIKPYELSGEPKLRFNWNTPIHASPNNREVLYIGAQYLYKTTDKGESWQRISPDLTTNDSTKQRQDLSGGVTPDNSSAENHCTIFAICESPVDEKIIWVGTDDGNVQVTTDGGESWRNVVSSIPGLPQNTWVSSIDASRFDRNTAYATFDGHFSGDVNTYVYKTTDLGRTWKPLVKTGIGPAAVDQPSGYAYKIKQDIVSPNLLFLGTCFGLYISIDDGSRWAKYTSGVPHEVEIRDIVIQPEYDDLILASHGRGIIIIDDISPLRHLTLDLLKRDVVILPSKPGYVDPPSLGGGFSSQAGEYSAPNMATDAVICYYLRERAVIGDFKIEILNDAGEVVARLPGTKRKGINRITWNMRMKPPRVAPGVRPTFAGNIGPMLPEGVYTIKLYKAEQIYTGRIELRSNPNSIHSAEDRALQRKIGMEVYGMMEDLAYLAANVKTVLEQVKKQKLTETAAKLDSLQKTIAVSREAAGITGEEQLRERIADLYGDVLFYYGRPTQSQMSRVAGLKLELQTMQDTFAEIIQSLSNIKTISREEWDRYK